MKKTLKIIAIASGIISAVSSVILAFIYLDEIVGQLNGIKTKIINKFSQRKSLNEDLFVDYE